MSARDDIARAALAEALTAALFREVNGGELESIFTIYTPEGVGIVLANAAREALRADPKVWLACAPADTIGDIWLCAWDAMNVPRARERLLALLDETKETDQ